MFELGKGDQGKFVCQMMRERGISSAEIAERLYVTESTISKWRKGKSDPSPEKIPMIAKILGITETEIYRARLLTAEETLEERISADIDSLRLAAGSSTSSAFGLAVMLAAFFNVFSIMWLYGPLSAPVIRMLPWFVIMVAFIASGFYVAKKAAEPAEDSEQ